MKLSEKIESKILKQQSVGHHTGAVIDYATLNSWLNEAHELEQKLNIHSVMQAEGSDGAKEAAVGQRSVDTNAEARVNCADGKHFWSMNKGIQQCLFCPAKREVPSGGHL